MTSPRGWAWCALGLIVGGAAVEGWHRLEDRPPRRLEATVMLPLVDNRDRKIPDKEWRSAVDLLVADFEGATLGAPLEGCWRDAKGNVRCEPVRPVTVSFAASQLPRFRRVLHEVGRRLGQEAMYARFEEPRVELLTVEPAP